MEIRFTRKDYVFNGKCSHDEYYGQFVSQLFANMVAERIGVDAILESTDPAMNDIALSRWDNLAHSMMYLRNYSAYEAWKKANDNTNFLPSLGECVCILKAAARKYKEMNS